MSPSYELEAGTGTRAWEVGRQERVDLSQSKWGSHSKCLLLSCIWLFMTPWTCQAPLSFTISWNLLGFMSIELVTLSNHLFLCCPFLLLPSIFSSIRVFSNELALHIRWPKFWSFSFCPFNEYSGLISFTIDWFGLFALQETLKNLLLHPSSKA